MPSPPPSQGTDKSRKLTPGKSAATQQPNPGKRANLATGAGDSEDDGWEGGRGGGGGGGGSDFDVMEEEVS